MIIEKLLLKLRERYSLTEQEVELLTSSMTETAEFGSGGTIAPQYEKINFCSLLIDGFACRSKVTVDGDRQIMEISIPGDFVDLHSYPLEQLDHSVTAISDCRIVKLPHQRLSEVIDKSTRLARILWFSTMVDASIHREWLVNIGQRRAAQRAAHLLCEMLYRLRVVEMTDDDSYEFPLTQNDLASSLALTSVHVSRVLKELRGKDLVSFRNKRVIIPDQEKLERFAGFDPQFLYLEARHG